MKIKNLKNSGFTLIELIVVIVILGIIAFIGINTLHQAFISSFNSQNYINVSWQARLALNRMSTELREAEKISSSSNANQLVFTDVYGETITYTLNGSNLTRNSQILMGGISGLTFTYVNANNQPEITVNQARCIKTKININTNGVLLDLENVTCPRINL